MRRGLEASRGSFWYTRKAFVSEVMWLELLSMVADAEARFTESALSIRHPQVGISSEPLGVNRLWSLEEKRFPPL